MHNNSFHNDSPKLLLQNHKATLTDSNSTENKFDVNFVNATTIQQTLGKAIWEYNSSTKYVSLLATNVSKVNIEPASLFEGNVDVNTQLSVGTTTTNKTTITPGQIVATNDTNSATYKSDYVLVKGTDASYIKVQNQNDALNAILQPGSINIKNTSTKDPYIVFTQNNTNYDVKLNKVADKKALNLNGELDVTSLVSTGAIKGTTLETTSGKVTFSSGGSTYTSDLKKDSTSTTIYSTNGFNVGQTGNQALRAGATTLSSLGVTNNVTVGGDITANNGTITGKKVVGAVYQRIW